MGAPMHYKIWNFISLVASHQYEGIITKNWDKCRLINFFNLFACYCEIIYILAIKRYEGDFLLISRLTFLREIIGLPMATIRIPDSFLFQSIFKGGS